MRNRVHFAERIAILLIVLLSALSIPCISVAQDHAVLQVQEFLGDLGFQPGRADGFWGPRTQRALQAFQEAQNIPATGELDEKTLGIMKAIREQEAATDRQTGVECKRRSNTRPQ